MLIVKIQKPYLLEISILILIIAEKRVFSIKESILIFIIFRNHNISLWFFFNFNCILQDLDNTFLSLQWIPSSLENSILRKFPFLQNMPL